MHFQKAAENAIERRKGMESLDHPGPLGPAGSRPGGEGDHRTLAPSQRFAPGRGTGFAVKLQLQFPARDVLQVCLRMEPVLAQSDPPGPQILADLLVLLGIESMP